MHNPHNLIYLRVLGLFSLANSELDCGRNISYTYEYLDSVPEQQYFTENFEHVRQNCRFLPAYNEVYQASAIQSGLH